jgi:hypothetical protein
MNCPIDQKRSRKVGSFISPSMVIRIVKVPMTGRSMVRPTSRM